MTRINEAYVTLVLGGLAGMADVDDWDDAFSHVDPNDECCVKEKVIRGHLIPYVSRIDGESMQKMKLALMSTLSTADYDFDRLFRAYLLPLDPPAPARTFFLWVWEELFPDHGFFIDRDRHDIYSDVNEVASAVRMQDQSDP